MKLLLTYFTFIVLSCNSTKSTNDNRPLNELKSDKLSLIYKAHTRGFFEEVSISESSVVLFKDYEKLKPITGTISEKEWKTCIDLVSSMELKSIGQLTAPSSLRQTDRAAYANLIVIKKGDTIKSSDFDHKNPPFELKQLVEHILSIKEN
tara:strand:+ start:46 stop:495 length:450 start_codon:yes stop_codon:yes gene_type:complete